MSLYKSRQAWRKRWSGSNYSYSTIFLIQCVVMCPALPRTTGLRIYLVFLLLSERCMALVVSLSCCWYQPFVTGIALLCVCGPRIWGNVLWSSQPIACESLEPHASQGRTIFYTCPVTFPISNIILSWKETAFILMILPLVPWFCAWELLSVGFSQMISNFKTIDSFVNVSYKRKIVICFCDNLKKKTANGAQYSGNSQLLILSSSSKF